MILDSEIMDHALAQFQAKPVHLAAWKLRENKGNQHLA